MDIWTKNLSKDFERTEPYVPELLSVRPKVLRISNMFTHKAWLSRMLFQLLLHVLGLSPY